MIWVYIISSDECGVYFFAELGLCWISTRVDTQGTYIHVAGLPDNGEGKVNKTREVSWEKQRRKAMRLEKHHHKRV